MSSLTFTDGLLILIEGDTKNQWWKAMKWQSEQFIEDMEFGTMKSMGFPNEIKYCKPFKHGNYLYRFIIKNDWGPCYIENMITKKRRRILYFSVNGDETRETEIT